MAAAEQIERRAFDPAAHLSDIKGKDYLEVKWRLVWFRADHPADSGWSIVTSAEEVTETAARYRAQIIDPEGRVVASATKTETKKGFPDFVEKAETGSIGRALALLGYGTQFCGDELHEGSRIVDSPVAQKAAKKQSSKPTAGPQNLGEFRQALTDLGIPPAQHQATCDAAAGRKVNMANMKPAAFAMVLNAVANPEPPEDPAPASTPAPPTVDHADGAGPFSETGWTAAQPPTPTQLGEWVGQFGLPAQTLQIARGLAGLPGEQHMREFDPDQCWRFYDCLRWRVQYDKNGTTWRLRLDEIGDQSQEAGVQ